MVRHYKKKTEASYTGAELQQAVQDVQNKNMTSYQAAEIYGIPRSTIVSRVYNSDMNDKVGRPLVLGEEVEKKIADSLHVMEKHGFPLTRKEVAVLVSQFVRRNGIKTPFKDDVPGKDWLQAFQKRNGLSIKKPQSVEIARRKACDPYIVYSYFNLLENVLTQLGLTDKPERVYNLDETSICSDPVKGKVIGKKGFRCTRTTSGPGRNNTTVLLATNACGKKVPPLIIFQGKHLWTEWMFKNQNIETAYAVSEKGWMQTSIFEKYLKSVFVPALGNDRPVLLIYDGHSTHVDLNVIQYAASEDITILKLPPHSSDVLQPLDCSTMKPLKDRWEDEIIKWQRLHIGAKLPKSEFARILTRIWDDLDHIILQNGFRKTGIHPLNRNAIREEIFDPLILQKWKNSQPSSSKPDIIEMNHLPVHDTHVIYSYDETQIRTKNVMPVVSLIPSLSTIVLRNINKQFTNGRITQKINDKPSPSGFSDITIGQEKACHIKVKMQNTFNIVKKTSKLPIPKKIGIPQSSSLKIIDCKIVKAANNTIQPVVSFEELLLKTIAKNDVPKTQKKRITNSNAEVLTYKDAIDRMKKEKEEKDKKLIDKENQKKLKEIKKNERKIISQGKKLKQPKRNIRGNGRVDKKSRSNKKSGTKKVFRRQKYELESDSSCSYVSLSETESEQNLESFYERIMHDRNSDSEYEDIERDLEKPTACSTSANVKASISGGHPAPRSVPASLPKLTPEEGKFVLAKFCSSKGKKIFKYVCMIENVTKDKMEVQGFHSIKKNKKIFRVIENDHSIIDEAEIIDYLPDPEVKGVDYIFPNDINVEEFN